MGAVDADGFGVVDEGDIVAGHQVEGPDLEDEQPLGVGIGYPEPILFRVVEQAGHLLDLGRLFAEGYPRNEGAVEPVGPDDRIFLAADQQQAVLVEGDAFQSVVVEIFRDGFLHVEQGVDDGIARRLEAADHLVALHGHIHVAGGGIERDALHVQPS